MKTCKTCHKYLWCSSVPDLLWAGFASVSASYCIADIGCYHLLMGKPFRQCVSRLQARDNFHSACRQPGSSRPSPVNSSILLIQINIHESSLESVPHPSSRPRGILLASMRGRRIQNRKRGKHDAKIHAGQIQLRFHLTLRSGVRLCFAPTTYRYRLLTHSNGDFVQRCVSTFQFGQFHFVIDTQ